MIIITDNSFNFIKYHVVSTNVFKESIFINFATTQEEVTELITDSILYSKEGDMLYATFIIKYKGPCLNLNKLNDSLNVNAKLYLIVEDDRLYKEYKPNSFTRVGKERTNNSNIMFLRLPKDQYEHNITFVKSFLDPNAYNYFWQHLCLNIFNNDPYKIYNEALYLQTFCKDDIKLSIDKLKEFYSVHKPSIKQYTDNINKYKVGLKILKTYSNNELYLFFIKGKEYKAPIESFINQRYSDYMYLYQIFKESFFNNSIRINESVFLFHYCLNYIKPDNIKYIHHVFKL